MKRISYFALATVSLILLVPGEAWAGHTLNENEKSVMDAWLRAHPAFRLARDADCECDTDISAMRRGYGGQWKPVPDYHPYVATGDFNGDGIEDFAVVVLDRTRKTKKFTLLVFNGPFGSGSDSPAYADPNVDMRGTGLFYGAPRPKPYRLVIGAFESEGYTLAPKGRTYQKD